MRRAWLALALATGLTGLLVRAADQPQVAAAGFWFAEASDIHITDTKSVEIVNDAVDQINGDGRVAFSLWLGDLTRQADADEMTLARLALQRLRKPWYTVRGNHDQTGDAYTKEFGALCRSFDHGGWRFLLLDSNPGDNTPLSAEVVAWLRDQLAQTDRAMPLVLCSHHPLMPHTKAYHLAGADEVLAMFQGYNLKAALSGHYHGNQEEVVDGVLFTTTACLSTTRTNFDGTTIRGYRLFHCDEGQITCEFVPVRDVPAG
jgi:3',5'-cyclic AMP phosphodiesterase CpdA